MPLEPPLIAGDVVQLTFPSGDILVGPVVFEDGELCILHQGEPCRLLMHEGKTYTIEEWPFGIERVK